MTRLLPFTLLALFACDGGETTPADTDLVADSEPTAGCGLPGGGRYDADGACFGMSMTVTLTLDTTACTFTLDEWNMVHNNMPTGGTITDADVALSGGDFDGCTGTVADGVLSGTCEGGCVWELAYDGE